MRRTGLMVLNSTAVSEPLVGNTIVEKDGKFYVYSKDGKKKLAGPYSTKEEATKRLGQIEHFKKNETINTITINLSPKIRHDTLEGRPYLVVPMVMITEGVHNGSAGPLYYPKEELQKTPEVWNHKPIVVYHPQINGVGVSACEPAILNSQKIGIILNSHTEDMDHPKDPKRKIIRLSAEAWLEEHRIKEVDNRVLERLQKGEMVELSTGLFADDDPTEGVWNAEEYKSVARNYRPDHLAILPDQKGACSIADGAGLLRNETSFSAIATLLYSALKEEYGTDSYCYVEDVFSTFVIYSKSGKLWKQSYTSTDTKATLVGEPEEVVKVVQYRTPDGTVVANVVKEVPNVTKAAMITLLLTHATTPWVEGDKAFLEKQDEKRLQQFVDALPKPKENKEGDKPKEEPKPLVPAPALKANIEGPKVQTLEEYINAAPPQLRGMLANGLRTYESEKQAQVKKVLAHPRNIFTENQLNTKDLEELKAITSLLPVENVAPSYAGLADAYAPRATGQVVNEEPLVMAKIEFEALKR